MRIFIFNILLYLHNLYIKITVLILWNIAQKWLSANCHYNQCFTNSRIFLSREHSPGRHASLTSAMHAFNATDLFKVTRMGLHPSLWIWSSTERKESYALSRCRHQTRSGWRVPFTISTSALLCYKQSLSILDNIVNNMKDNYFQFTLISLL